MKQPEVIDLNKLRDLVRETCHTPILVAGQFVAVDSFEAANKSGLRKEIATYDEMLRALELHVCMLKSANAYLQTQLPRKPE